MPNTNLTEVFTGIANSIREKNGTTDTYKPTEMAAAIVNLPTGGGFDISSLNHVDITAPSKYTNYSKLPDLTPYVDNIDKIVAMVWCGDNSGSVYVYFRGIKNNRIFLLKDIYGISSSNSPIFQTPTSSNYYSINGDLSGLQVKTYPTSSTMSSAFANGLIMLYED